MEAIQIQIPIPNKYLGFINKGLVFCKNIGLIKENMDMPKWVLIVWPEITQMPQSLSTQFICPSPNVLDFNEKNASFDICSPWSHLCGCPFVLQFKRMRGTQIHPLEIT